MYVQCAVTYRNKQGERRIRVHTSAFTVTDDVATVFRNLDCETITNWVIRTSTCTVPAFGYTDGVCVCDVVDATEWMCVCLCSCAIVHNAVGIVDGGGVPSDRCGRTVCLPMQVLTTLVTVSGA